MKTYAKTILVVEDNEHDQMLIKSAFRSVGVTHPIQVARDGADAIEYMRGEGRYADRDKYAYPTFVTTDLKMPQVDGFGVLEFLKNNPQWRIIPAVILSGSADADDVKKAYMLGASSYHVKPPTQAGLCQLLKTLNDYWETCEVPEVDRSGKQLPTDGVGKLGQRFTQPVSNEVTPHRSP